MREPWWKSEGRRPKSERRPKPEILTWRSQNQKERKSNREIREIREKKSPDEELAVRIVRMLWRAGFFSFAYFAYFAVPQIEAILDAISEGRSECRKGRMARLLGIDGFLTFSGSVESQPQGVERLISPAAGLRHSRAPAKSPRRESSSI